MLGVAAAGDPALDSEQDQSGELGSSENPIQTIEDEVNDTTVTIPEGTITAEIVDY
jgi:hypothetical protein